MRPIQQRMLTEPPADCIRGLQLGQKTTRTQEGCRKRIQQTKSLVDQQPKADCKRFLNKVVSTGNRSIEDETFVKEMYKETKEYLQGQNFIGIGVQSTR